MPGRYQGDGGYNPITMNENAAQERKQCTVCVTDIRTVVSIRAYALNVHSQEGEITRAEC
jgi:hypothetical protein